jgi:DNA-binding NtrC family response regulator
MTTLTQTGTDISLLPRPSPGSARGKGTPGLLSVLCVSDDPLFRDRICRNLERDGGIFVEIAATAEDALHLMTYLFFDAIVTDCVSWQGKENGFLRAMREQGIAIPFIYFIRNLEFRIQEEARQFGLIRSVVWSGQPVCFQFETLLQCIHDMTDRRTGGTASDRSG